RLERIEHAKGLTDAKGRSISTVRAVAITNIEEDKANDDVRVKEDQLMTAMLKLQGDDASFTKWAEHLSWINSKGEPDKKSVENAIRRLGKGKPALIEKYRDKWKLTEKGKEVAREAAIRFDRQKQKNDQSNLF